MNEDLRGRTKASRFEDLEWPHFSSRRNSAGRIVTMPNGFSKASKSFECSQRRLGSSPQVAVGFLAGHHAVDGIIIRLPGTSAVKNPLKFPAFPGHLLFFQ